MAKDHGVLPSQGQPPAETRVDQRGGQRSLPVGASRYPSGRRRTHRSLTSMTLWQRLRATSVLQEVGHVVGRLFFSGELTEAQASAALRYAEIVGRYDRYFNHAGRSTPKSPSYMRGWGHDNEIEQHQKNGTMPDYERRARDARKAYQRLQKHIPNDLARSVLDDLCIHETEVSPLIRSDVRVILNLIAIEFGAGRGNERK